MSTVLTSPELIVNAALTKLGYPGRVNDLRDGSPDSTYIIPIYSEARDALLRSSTCDFAKKTTTLTTSGQTAPVPWAQSYIYPTDCLQVRNVYLASAQLADLNDPLPTTWSVGDDPTAGKVIFSNIATATIVYTARITNPSQWDSMFIDSLIDGLATALAGRYNKEYLKALQEIEIKSSSAAEMVVG